MFDRFTKAFFAAFSTLSYIILLFLILAIPFYLAYEGKKNPEFTVTAAGVTAAGGDAYLAAKGSDGAGIYKITYSCTASARRGSPYDYKVDHFVLTAPREICSPGNYELVSPETPVAFRKGSDCDFTLTLYVRCDGETARRVAREARFGARGLVIGFSVFENEKMFGLPGFSADTAAVRE